MKIGIVGLPNVGKSTLFNVLSGQNIPVAPYPFTTIKPNVAVVGVPDERLEKIAKLLNPEKVRPATIEIIDLAGIVKGAHEGKGLGNEFLSHIYEVDAILILLRTFEDSNVPRSAASPEEELEIILEELKKKDESLFSKPRLIVCNGPMRPECEGSADQLPQIIKLAYRILNLITFYTVKGGKEVSAWPVLREANILLAAGKVHTDFKEKFIRAEVMPFERLLEAGTWQKAREKGWLKSEGKDYAVRDGDVIEFKI